MNERTSESENVNWDARKMTSTIRYLACYSCVYMYIYIHTQIYKVVVYLLYTNKIIIKKAISYQGIYWNWFEKEKKSWPSETKAFASE